MFLLAELERETKMLQFDVCHKAIDQNFDCGCDSYSAPKQKAKLSILETFSCSACVCKYIKGMVQHLLCFP